MRKSFNMKYHIAVILTDVDRKILWVNNDFTAITGYSLSEVMGKKPSLLQGEGTDPTDVQRIREQLAKQEPFKDEILNYRKNGEHYPCQLSIYPVFDGKNELTNFIAFEVDGSEMSDPADVLSIGEKYQTSSLKSSDAARLFARLQYILRTEKIYLDPKLTLQKLANLLETNTKYLSQVVNFHGGMNLQRFVNNYRVNEAKAKILSQRNQNLTLFGVATQCGFKNKSTFYKVFKQTTGMTPMEFIKSHATENAGGR